MALMIAQIFRYGRGFVLELREGKNKGYGEIAPLEGWNRESPQEAFDQLVKSLATGLTSHLFPSVAFGIYSAYLDLKHPLEGFDVEVKPKVKLGDLTLREAESLIYPGVRVDINRQWPLEKALAFFRRFPIGMFDFIEEPVDRFEDLKTFAEETGHPIALDETAREKPLELLRQLPHLKAFVIKPTMQRNSLEFLSQREIPCVLSSSHETPLGIRRIAELKQRFPFTAYPMGLLPHQNIGAPLPIWNGKLRLQEIHFNPCYAQLLTTLENVRVL